MELEELNSKFIKKVAMLLFISTVIGTLLGFVTGIVFHNLLIPTIVGGIVGIILGISFSGYIAFWKMKG